MVAGPSKIVMVVGSGIPLPGSGKCNSQDSRSGIPMLTGSEFSVVVRSGSFKVAGNGTLPGFQGGGKRMTGVPLPPFQ